MFLITRPAGKADNLLQRLDELAVAYHYQPVITTQSVQLKPHDLQMLQQAEWIILVSLSAVHALEQQLDPAQLTAPLVAVGETTATALQRWTGRRVIVPQDQRSEGLLALPELQEVAGNRVVIVRGNAGRELIKQGLSQRGALVRYVQSYRRLPLPLNGELLCQQWQQQNIECVVATSNEILHRIFEIVPPSQHPWLISRQWILVSPRARDSALQLGILPVHIHLADNANDEALLHAIQQLIRI